MSREDLELEKIERIIETQIMANLSRDNLDTAIKQAAKVIHAWYKQQERKGLGIDYNCTLAKLAEQLDVPLWKAMEFKKYYTQREVELLEDILKRQFGVPSDVDTSQIWDVVDIRTIQRLINQLNEQLIDERMVGE